VYTPQPVISLFWNILSRRRERLGKVLDMGAGDGRFAIGGNYRQYDGVEIDPLTTPKLELPHNARILPGCAFRHQIAEYDACIGNPPYVRHHDLEPPWKKRTMKRLNNDLGIEI
jgi:methylase of polypeptide subunit release factors